MKYIAFLLMLSGMLAMAGCNTVRGVGQDVQKAGEVIQGAAQKK